MRVCGQSLPFGGGENNPKLIVIHSMAEYIAWPDGINRSAWASLKYLKLSAHVLGLPNGEVVRARANEQTAWHAGKCDDGTDGNIDSLGYEFLVQGLHNYDTWCKRIKEDWVTPEQWDSGVRMVKAWLLMYPDCKVVRHSDIAPSRKMDPGDGFKWQKFLEAIKCG
jgi:N-acetyl-anhydromuramoyl-L-alanine amidase